jgi:hypothetical protein|nr:hypothetical protein [Kofleriaceae bacterium]
MTRLALIAALIAMSACGGTSAPPPAPPPKAAEPPQPTAAELEAQRAADDQRKHDDLVAAHRKLEDEEQTALAATCDAAAKQAAKPRCLPSCYAAEAADPRAATKLSGSVEIQHLVCDLGAGAYAIVDELDGKLAVRRASSAARAHRKGSWQYDVEHALAADGLVVTGAWHDVTHPVTHDKLRCVAASHYTTLRKPLDACGGAGDVVCEASGNATAHGMDVAHLRLAEARRLHAGNDTAGCQQAALEAVAVARGLPRWRQYMKLNVDHWPKGKRYRTRLDGTLDEDALFAAAATLQTDAEAEYAACGGASPKTSPEQEQSFHTCW